MELETIRMCAAAAADSVIGINAMIDALPIDGEDTRPESITLYNSVDDAWVARKAVPEKDATILYPVVAIALAQPLTVHEVNTTVRDADAAVMFAYIVRDVDAAKASRDALYVNRAVLRFLRRFAGNDAAAFRSRNGILLVNPLDTTQGQTSQDWNKAVAVAATVITWRVRETAA